MVDALVEEIFSDDRSLKIEIHRRPDGTLRLYTFYWYEENVPEYDFAESGWARMTTDVTITDTIERARMRAHELLRETPRPIVFRPRRDLRGHMRKFRVMLEGRNVALLLRRWFRRRRENVGFFTTRLVSAEDETLAAQQAISLVRAELHESGMGAFQGDSIVVRCKQIEELSSFDDAEAPGRGFTFFPEGS